MTEPNPTGSAERRGPQPVPMEPGGCAVPHDWSRYSLDQLWAMLERQSAVSGQIATEMWAFMDQLCETQAQRLETALMDLREHWPTKQEAARAFQEWGASLVAAMRCTAETARTNGPVPVMIGREIEAARDKVLELQNRASLYQDQLATLSAGSPHPVTRELLDVDRQSLLGRQASLNHQAQEVMADLEQKIYHYARGLVADPPYVPPLEPGIAPPVGTDGRGASGSGNSSWDGNGFTSAAAGWSPDGWAPSDDIRRPDEGPFPNGGGTPGSGATPGDDAVPGDGTVLDGVRPAPGPIGAAGSTSSGGGGVFVDTPWGRVLAPGGVIGAPAGGVGTAPSGGSAGPGLAAGLTAGPASAGRLPAGAGMVPFVPPMMAGQPGTPGTTTGTTGRRHRRGLPSVFQTPPGPPAVIRPPDEPTEHDPGPGVIGIDR